jgi:hypothetical protein
MSWASKSPNGVPPLCCQLWASRQVQTTSAAYIRFGVQVGPFQGVNNGRTETTNFKTG